MTPRPTKSHDPAKEQRKIEHAQRQEAAAAKRRAEGATREAARQSKAPVGLELPNTGTTPPINPTPPITLPTLPLPPQTASHNPPLHDTANLTIDPNLNNTGEEDRDIFLDPVQDNDEENQDEVLDLNSQNDNNQSKTISGVKELQPHPPEDDASSAKKPRTGISQETPLNE